MDGGEQVDGVPMLPSIAEWMRAFVDVHYKPEPRRKVRRNDPLADAAARRQARPAAIAAEPRCLKSRPIRKVSRCDAGRSASTRGARPADGPPRRRRDPDRRDRSSRRTMRRPRDCEPRCMARDVPRRRATRPAPPRRSPRQRRLRPAALPALDTLTIDSDYTRVHAAGRRRRSEARRAEEALPRSALQRDGRARRLHRRLFEARSDRSGDRAHARAGALHLQSAGDARERRGPCRGRSRRASADEADADGDALAGAGRKPRRARKRRSPAPPPDARPVDAAVRAIEGSTSSATAHERLTIARTLHFARATARCRSIAMRSRARTGVADAAAAHGDVPEGPRAFGGSRGRRHARRLHAGAAAAGRRRGRRRARAVDPLRQHPRDRRLVGGSVRARRRRSPRCWPPRRCPTRSRWRASATSRKGSC